MAETTSTKTAEIQKETPLARPVRDDDALSKRLCNEWVENGLTKNKAIQFLIKQLDDLGCSPPPNFIRCAQCDQPSAGGFGMVEETKRIMPSSSSTLSSNGKNSDCTTKMRNFQDVLNAERNGEEVKIKPEIYICQQYVENEIMTHKTLVHELIHAVDLCRTNMDPLHNCLQLACTEIRAENLSGECSLIRELPRMSSFRGHGAVCVQRRAELSVRANPRCTARASEYVQAAMPRCYKDLYPFDRHPNQQ